MSSEPEKLPLISSASKPCILCGKCLEACPLFAATGREELSPRAKYLLADALDHQTPELREKALVSLASKCLSCGRCGKACPRGLSAAELVASVKSAHPGLDSRLWRVFVENARVLWPVLVTLSRFAPRLGLAKADASLQALTALDARSRLAPWLRPTSFDPCGKGRKAVMFPGCTAAHARRDWTDSALRLMDGLGFERLPRPDFACCGRTLGQAGLADARQAMRMHNLRAWRAAGRPEIVTFCASCALGLTEYATSDLPAGSGPGQVEYGASGLPWEPGEAERWRNSLVPLSELAAHVRFEVLEHAPALVHYHAPCHGGDNDLDLAFLRDALGDRLAPGAGANPCCGFGGSLKLAAPELSGQVARRCVDFYGPRPGERILTGCAGCAVQLRTAAPDTAGHWLESIRWDDSTKT